ncbi:MAG TPA: hypothetical protein VGP72_18335 [Planctomycetota bacterium]|jgi:hypothetical protein
MAKKRKPAKSRPESEDEPKPKRKPQPEVVDAAELDEEEAVEEDAEDPFAGVAEETEKDAGPAAKPGGFFSSLSDGLKAAGQAAEKYARLGVNVAELEKLRLQLKVAYGKLGESIVKCWDAAPDIGVAAGDPAVNDPVRRIRDLRRRIREIEIKLKQAGKTE